MKAAKANSAQYQAAWPLGRAAALLFAAVLLLSFASVAGAQDTQKNKKKSGSESSQASKTPPPEARRILVFPTDARGGVSDQVGDDIMNTIESKLTATKLYEPVQFLGSIPTVKLALSEGTLSQSDVKKPFDSDVKLKKLSGITGYDMVLVSSIDDYEYDAAKNQVTVVMSARMIDYAGAKPVVRSAAQSAVSPDNAGNTAELKLATALVKSLADKLLTSILTPRPATK